MRYFFFLLSMVVSCVSPYALAQLSTAGADFSFSEEEILPDAPTSHVLDEAGILAQSPEKLEKISALLLALKEKYNFPVYLVTGENFTMTHVRDLAQNYYEQWIGSPGDGLVIYYDRDQNTFGEGWRMSGIEETSSPVPYEKNASQGKKARAQIPDYIIQDSGKHLQEIFTKRKAEGEDYKKMEKDDLLLDFSTELGRFFDNNLSKLHENATDHNQNDLFMIYLLGFIVLLGGVLCWFWQTQSQKRRKKSLEEFWMPKVLVGTRLGAKYGGGTSGEISFDK